MFSFNNLLLVLEATEIWEATNEHSAAGHLYRASWQPRIFSRLAELAAICCTPFISMYRLEAVSRKYPPPSLFLNLL